MANVMRVLVVDDSAPFRTQIRKALDNIPGVEVVGSASNGKIALQMLTQKSVDLVTLDLNMPEMDGMETLKEMRRLGHKTKVIIFTGQSARAAKTTIEALSAGADDFVLKPESETFSIDSASEQVVSQLVPRILQFLAPNEVTMASHAPAALAALAAGSERRLTRSSNDSKSSGETSRLSLVDAKAPGKHWPKVAVESFIPRFIVVASSTGGPAALEIFLSQLKGPPRVPVLIAQHMPETFTKYLGKRLSSITGIECREGIHGEQALPGRIYIAPGNYHMRITTTAGIAASTILLDQDHKVNSVRPAADLLFDSAAAAFGSNLMGFVLTGMGEDGCNGAKNIKATGGCIMIQDKESCVVWGMPSAVFNSGAYDKIGDIKDCARILAKMCN